jgi:hypothetical protein
MIIFKIILGLILSIGHAVYLANSVPALITEKQKDPNNYWSSNLLLFSGTMSFLMLILFIMFMFNNIEEDFKVKEKPQYEIIQEPLYRKLP